MFSPNGCSNLSRSFTRRPAFPAVVIERPPKVEMGDFAIPIFPFAKPVRSAPLKIAEAIRGAIGTVEGIAELTVAPPGYLNVKADRTWLASALASDKRPSFPPASGKILVEHTSINPNKAAHIGHLRNAVLGDTLVRLLRYAASGHPELHRRHRRPGRGRRRRLHPYREEIEGRDRGPHPPAPIRLLLLGLIRPRVAVVRSGQGKQRSPAADLARHRRPIQRSRRDRGLDLGRRTSPPP